MRPRWRKTISDLRDNKLRTLLVVLSIAVGVFSVGMVAGAYTIISNDMVISYSSANPANIRLWVDVFDDEMINVIEDIPGVGDVAGRRQVDVQGRIHGGQWINLDLIAMKNFIENRINLLLPIEGSPDAGNKEVLLERKTLEDLQIEVGETLQVQMPDGDIHDLSVAGIVQDQTSAAGDFLAAPMAYVTLDTLEWLGQPRDFNRMFITVNGDSNDLSQIERESASVSDKLEKSGRQVYRTELSKTAEHPMMSTVQAILGVLGALGVLIVLLSSSLIANTLNALLNQHMRFIGVMKLIGGRSFQIIGMYMVLIVIFGLIALLIAIPLGGQAAYALASLIADQMNFVILGYRLVPTAIMLQVLIAIIIPLAAGIIPVYNGARTSILHAINGDASAISKSPRLLGKATPRRFHLPRPMLLSIRNTFRRKGRLALTLLTLTMGGAIFIAVFNVRVTLHNYVDQISNYFLADLIVDFDRLYRLDEVQQILKEVPGIQAVEGWTFISAEAIPSNGGIPENLPILAPPADSTLVKPVISSGRWIQPGDEKTLTVSEGILEKFPDLKAGDRLKIKLLGRDEIWTVAGLFKFVGRDQVLAYASYDYISDTLNQRNKASSFRIVTDQHSESYQKEKSAEVDQILREKGLHVEAVEAGFSTMKAASEGLDTLISFLLIMALLTAVVGCMGLAGTMGMNVLERTREIGVMRSIGAVNFEVIKVVIVEGLVIGLVSWLLAALLSFPFSLLLNRIISLAIFNAPIDLIVSWEGFALWLLVVFILSAIASVLPARNASRLTIREVLAYE